MPVDQLTGYGTLEVALRLGISTEMVRYWANRGLLPAVKLSGRLYFDRAVVDRIAEAREGRTRK
jgi:DNA-binding transcriptional MerR regulator